MAIKLAPGEGEIIRQILLPNFNFTLTHSFSRYNCPEHKREEPDFSVEHGFYYAWNWCITWEN